MGSLDQLCEQLDSFRELQANWDSHGARPIAPRVIEWAKQIARRLPATIAWRAVPLPDGGVRFESDDVGIEIHWGREEG